MDAIEQFKGAMRAHEINPPEIIEPGKLYRFSANGKRGDDAGWCKLFPDGEGGVFGDFRSGLSETWQARREKTLTSSEREAFRRRCEQELQKREAEQASRHAEARDKARSLWKAATPARADHPYFARKGISPVDTLREIPAGEAAEILGYTPKSGDEPLTGRLLIVPVKVGGELSTVEMIDEGGRKSALYGGAKRGGYWAAQPLPEGDGAGLTLLIGEGVATVLSAREATGHLALAALSCGNLEPVAKAMRDRYPKAKLVILADLVKGADEPNQHAVQAARTIDGLLFVPDFGNNRTDDAKDTNDMAVLRGLEAVGRAIANTKAPAGGEAQPVAETACYRRVSDIEAKPIRWLWPGRIASCKVSMLAGHPGLGKSQVTVSMAAVVTTGGLWPVDRTSCDRGSVIILSAEDDPADTIRPRLEAAGADLDRCYTVDAVREPNKGGAEL